MIYKEYDIEYWFDENKIDLSSFERLEFYQRIIYLHRTDGPAIIRYDNGDEWWVRDGLIHRTDGPAITWGMNPKYNERIVGYYLWGKSLSVSAFREIVEYIKANDEISARLLFC